MRWLIPAEGRVGEVVVGAGLTSDRLTRPPVGMTRRLVAGFVWTLVRTDFKTRYHGTLAGFFWALLKPLIMFVALMSVFSYAFASTPNYKLDLIIGLFLWDFFAEGTKAGMTSLHAKGYLLAKARFPSWVVVVASASNALMTLGVFCLVILTYLALDAHLPGPVALTMFFVYLFEYYLIVLGISLASSALFVRYRDLNQVWDVVTQAGFFIAPIIYPLAILPERVHFYLYVWPPTPVIQFARAVLVTGTVPTARANVFLALVAAIVLATGIIVFRRYAPRAAEYL